jgi:hypothetical protein
MIAGIFIPPYTISPHPPSSTCRVLHAIVLSTLARHYPEIVASMAQHRSLENLFDARTPQVRNNLKRPNTSLQRDPTTLQQSQGNPPWVPSWDCSPRVTLTTARFATRITVSATIPLDVPHSKHYEGAKFVVVWRKQLFIGGPTARCTVLAKVLAKVPLAIVLADFLIPRIQLCLA